MPRNNCINTKYKCTLLLHLPLGNNQILIHITRNLFYFKNILEAGPASASFNRHDKPPKLVSPQSQMLLNRKNK